MVDITKSKDMTSFEDDSIDIDQDIYAENDAFNSK